MSKLGLFRSLHDSYVTNSQTISYDISALHHVCIPKDEIFVGSFTKNYICQQPVCNLTRVGQAICLDHW